MLILLKHTKAECVHALKGLALPPVSHSSEIAAGRRLRSTFAAAQALFTHAVATATKAQVFSSPVITVQIIERVRAAGGCTLLHCQLGVSRSGALAIAYIMWLHNCSFADALLRAQAGRGCINPNPGFVAQLLEWEADLTHIREGGSPCFTCKWYREVPKFWTH